MQIIPPTYVAELEAIEAMFELSTNARVNSQVGENIEPGTACFLYQKQTTNDELESPVRTQVLDAIAGLLELHMTVRINNPNDEPNSRALNNSSLYSNDHQAAFCEMFDAESELKTIPAMVNDLSEEPSTSRMSSMLVSQQSSNMNAEMPRDLNTHHSSRRSKIFKRKPVKYTPVINNISSSESDITVSGSDEENIYNPNEVQDVVYKMDVSIQVDDADDWYESQIIKPSMKKIAEKIQAFIALIRENTVHEERRKNDDQNGSDLIPIGSGNTMIPASVYRHMNWRSYTVATRKLLTTIFSRKVLATHSLTGRISNAFPMKPAKAKLDATKVNDIVQTVVQRCGVSESLVRTSITTKCADESKLYRSRLQSRQKRHRI